MITRIHTSFILFLFFFSSFVWATSGLDKAAHNQDESALSSVSTPHSSVIDSLYQMQDAVLHTDYRMHFIVQEDEEFAGTFQYNHLGSNQQNYANLIYLEGESKEIILHNDIVSYFQSDRMSFSLSTNRIIEVFPDIIYSDFNQLEPYYDFVLLGKARTANRSSQLVKIIPKDKDRYSYVIWIDGESHLPLRIDLFDLDSKNIKQIKTLILDQAFDKKSFKNYIEDRDYPILFSADKEEEKQFVWRVTDIPKGFTESSAYNVNFYQSEIETRLFSDGVFSFTINVSPSSEAELTHFILQGERTVYSVTRHNMNIVIIGNLPLKTIEYIANSITTDTP